MIKPEGATAAMRYKDIIGLARASAEHLRAWELTRAQELENALAEATEAVTVATRREQWATERAIRWWKMAVHNITGLTWLDAREKPEPATTARAHYLDRYLEDIKPSYQELVQAVRALGWRARR